MKEKYYIQKTFKNIISDRGQSDIFLSYLKTFKPRLSNQTGFLCLNMLLRLSSISFPASSERGLKEGSTSMAVSERVKCRQHSVMTGDLMTNFCFPLLKSGTKSARLGITSHTLVSDMKFR